MIRDGFASSQLFSGSGWFRVGWLCWGKGGVGYKGCIGRIIPGPRGRMHAEGDVSPACSRRLTSLGSLSPPVEFNQKWLEVGHLDVASKQTQNAPLCTHVKPSPCRNAGVRPEEPTQFKGLHHLGVSYGDPANNLNCRKHPFHDQLNVTLQSVLGPPKWKALLFWALCTATNLNS